MSAESPAVLIAALSGRALVASARRAGFRPLVADLFGDDDTRDLAEASERVPGSIARGLSRVGLIAALDRLAATCQVRGLVCGSGFEDRPKLLETLSRRFTLLGNAPDVVARLKNPSAFASLCAALDIPHPEIRTSDIVSEPNDSTVQTLADAAPARPDVGDGPWLDKQIGASGGGHVVSLRGQVARRRRYHQRRVGGLSISAAFLADGSRARLLATSRQWTDPTRRAPFRYGGAVRPSGVSRHLEEEMARIVERLTRATGLRGLNSADFIVRPNGFDLLEVNPRPGATLDLLDSGDGAPFHMHVAACQGNLPAHIEPLAAAAAAMVVYAPVPMHTRIAWPDWTADRQPADTPVARGAPLCTVLAHAEDAATAERLVRRRAADILTVCRTKHESAA